MTTQVPGGFSPFSSDINAEAKAAFAEAMEGFVGVSYSPVAVANQVVNGINYAFFCNAQIPGSPFTYPAMVSVYAPRGEKAMLTHIEKVTIG